MKVTYCRKLCCTVKWCPLVTSWATPIHKFQGFETEMEDKDMFRQLICDPSDLKWEQLCPGAFYVTLSWAKTMGKFRSKYKFTRKSAIYWVGDGINKIRIVEGYLKNGQQNGDPKVKCENIQKRDCWVNYLKQQQDSTASRKFNKSEIRRFHKTRFTQSDLHFKSHKW